MIPYVFHLTAKSMDIPPEFENNRQLIKQMYPEHTIQLHDDEAIDIFAKKQFPQNAYPFSS